MKPSLPLNWLELNEAFPATQLWTGALPATNEAFLELNEAIPQLNWSLMKPFPATQLNWSLMKLSLPLNSLENTTINC